MVNIEENKSQLFNVQSNSIKPLDNSRFEPSENEIATEC